MIVQWFTGGRCPSWLSTTLTSGRVLQCLRPVRDAASPSAAAEFCDRFDTAVRALTTIQRV